MGKNSMHDSISTSRNAYRTLSVVGKDSPYDPVPFAILDKKDYDILVGHAIDLLEQRPNIIVTLCDKKWGEKHGY